MLRGNAEAYLGGSEMVATDDVDREGKAGPAPGSSVKSLPLSSSPDVEIISPDSSLADQSSDGVQSSLQCPRCKQVFTGKKRYSNLARHMILVHPHKREEFKCSIQGCTSVFTRSDNLLIHQRYIH